MQHPDLPPPTLPPAPTPISNTVVHVAGGIAVITIIGVVVVAILRPNDGQTITIIITAGGSLVAAFLALTANRGVQIVHQMMNSRMDAYLETAREQAADRATLIERAAGAAAAKTADALSTAATLAASEAAAKAASEAASAAITVALQAQPTGSVPNSASEKGN